MLPEPTPAWARSTISSARFGFSHRFRRPVHLLEPGVFRLWDVMEGVVDAGGLLAAGRQRETLRLDTARGEVFLGPKQSVCDLQPLPVRCLRFEIDEILELDAKAVRYADEGAEPRIARSFFDLAESRSIHSEHSGKLLLGKPRGFSQAHYLLTHFSFCS